MQSSSSAFSVGYQHKYKNSFVGLWDIYKKDGILNGLWKGATAHMLRVGVASAVQLSTYDSIKNHITSLNVFPENGFYVHFFSSFIASIFTIAAMNPVDVINTRIYNQKVEKGKGTLYNGILDCFIKILKTEGLYGFYKGSFAHYLRIGPHTVLTFIFWEQFKKLAKDI